MKIIGKWFFRGVDIENKLSDLSCFIVKIYSQGEVVL